MDLDTLFEGVELGDDAKALLAEKFKGAVEAEVTGLKGKNAELLGKLGEQKTAAQKLAEEKALAEEERQKALGNYEAAQKLADERIAKEREQYKADKEGLESQLRELYVTNEYKSIAAELANTPDDIQILSMFLKDHVSMNRGEDGKYQTTYGEHQNRQALIDSFKKNPAMARFIKGTGASGVGAQGASGQGKAGSQGKKFSDLKTPAEKAAYLESRG